MADATPTDVPLDLFQRHVGTITSYRSAENGYMSDLLMFVDTDAGRWFVKGQRNRPGGRLESLQREALINPYVQPIAPKLHWQLEDDQWVLLVFEAVKGRPAHFDPGAEDLPLIISTLRRIPKISPPDFTAGWTEDRWDRFTDDSALFRGGTLLYTDLNADNFLVTETTVRLADWAWPTVGAGFIDPALLVMQLVAAHHTPEGAEQAVAQCEQWHRADSTAIDAFCIANVNMWAAYCAKDPTAGWKKAMLAACQRWAEYRGIAPPAEDN
ncbi:hypothetical protein GCM10023205_40610 [Yinghuangia aomiensis]|uniref:Phosphotransferase enzyme family protein n=1 Tax=Yinghuangia aomiensis TaxID=676205 RepID=A0ABP9HH04_9ACTN